MFLPCPSRRLRKHLQPRVRGGLGLQRMSDKCSGGGITGSAVALHCCKAHAKINGKIENSTPCKIVIHEDFNLKLGTRD